MTFEEKFWKIWYEGQTPKECAMKWLPEKRPAQVVEEFIEYLKIVSVIEKPAVLEIGVAQGQQRRFYEKLLKCRRKNIKFTSKQRRQWLKYLLMNLIQEK